MEQIRGYIEHFVYRNPENGYGVMNFVSDGDEITCVGSFPDVNEGESLELTGEMVEHPVYGEQLKVSSYTHTDPADKESMERYLSSGAIKGIGPAIAKRIMKRFGDDAFRIIEEEPERLAEIKGISLNGAREIALQMAEKRELREIMMFLQQYGISPSLGLRIFKRYGDKTTDVVRNNPYRMAEDISGIGFRTADEIASRLGIRPDSSVRIQCGLQYVLSCSSLDGHTWLPLYELIQRTSELLVVDVEAVRHELDSLAIDRKLIIRSPSAGIDPTDELSAGYPDSAELPQEEPQVYSSRSFFTEQGCAVKLHKLLSDPVRTSRSLSEIRSRLNELEQHSGLDLDELQRKAVEMSLSGDLLILTGGPGTGKTTTINTILKLCEMMRLDVLLAAPTGRAAKRVQEATGYEARTIHRLLEVNGIPADDRNDPDARDRVFFSRNEENQLEADVIIIDEMSMVDVFLFHALLKAISSGTQLILVGDSAQLPSVGPGQVLKDLLDSGHFPSVQLKKIFRQAEESDIVMNAHHINRGEHIKLDNKSNDFFFMPRDSADVIYKHLVTLIRDKLPPYVGAPSSELQVLTPMRKGPLGVEALNRVLQQYLNPASPSRAEHNFGERLFREGDKVMQTRNNYDAEWEITGANGIVIDRGCGIFNGDMGRIMKIDERDRMLTVEFDDHRVVVFPFQETEDMELAYAVTIHKSQGSEYPAVILPLLSGPHMLMNRNLLYTAVTRARRLVVILGREQTINEMIANESELLRHTGLKDRISEVFRSF